jgi:hypothetical protein
MSGAEYVYDFSVKLGHYQKAMRPLGLRGTPSSKRTSFQGVGESHCKNACQKENERISTTPFLLSHFSPSDKIENCSAQFLAVCWIVHIEFKVHRLRDGLSVSNALLLSQSLPAFIGHNLDKIGDGTVL